MEGKHEQRHILLEMKCEDNEGSQSDFLSLQNLEERNNESFVILAIARATHMFKGYSLLKIPNLVSFASSSSSISSLHSHSVPASTRQVDEAVDSFTRMLSMRRTPPIIQFNKILGSLSKTKHFHAAVSLFQQLQIRGIAPSVVTLSIVINCCCGMGRMTLAFSVSCTCQHNM
ncbi:hypothetical protein AHAS_Ahas15G0310700 [Arachis hypogaea]